LGCISVLSYEYHHTQAVSLPPVHPSLIQENRIAGDKLRPNDYMLSVQETFDGGFIVGGFSSSGPGGNKTSLNYGGYDCWVLLLDGDGNIIWDNSFGAQGDDYVESIALTADGGFIFGGYSNSPPSGNKTSPNYGGRDYWVVRLDANGNKVWEQVYGGHSLDEVYSIHQTSDGGFFVGGLSGSGIEYNKTTPSFGGYDFWVLKLAPDMDTTPPTILSTSAEPSVLWAPDHKMIDVTVTADLYDNCDQNPVCMIVNVTSNEPINGPGDGNTKPDWIITGDLTVQLRAERSGVTEGRIYTIHLECKDASGNSATAVVTVTVPHDKKKK